MKKRQKMITETYNIFDELADLLASMDPIKVLAFHTSAAAQKRLEQLLTINKEGALTQDETLELERFMTVEHIVRVAKARARQQLAAI